MRKLPKLSMTSPEKGDDMFERLYTPKAAIEDEIVVRRAGLFYRKKIKLTDIERVVAVVKDAVTHEEIAVGFFDKARDRVWLSEFDTNFADVMRQLGTALPGFIPPNGLAGGEPFGKTQKILWERPT
ncbi:MAG: hypothetical protein M3414_08350 [Pseudomonadota bacterium]|nr:hypothetical protein [Pseudomonadota bacterium]